MALSFTDRQIQEQAESLGLVERGEELPRHLRSRVVASLAANDASRPSTAEETAKPRVARSISVQQDGEIKVDGATFPWAVARDRMEVVIDPDRVCTVRLTLLAESVQIAPPAHAEPAQITKPDRTESENRA